MTTPLLTVSDLTLGYQETPLMSDVSFSLQPGEVCAIVGHSGTGKTTLLHTIAGILPVTNGRVHFRDQDISLLSGKDRQVYLAQRLGLVFQAFHIVPFLSVEDNVALSPVFGHTWQGHELSQKVREVLDQVGLADMAGKYARELSGGQRQRVAIARAMVNAPDLILADEPTGNLDQHTGDTVMETLVDLARNRGSSMIFVTHEEAYLRLADRVFAVENGKLLQR